MNDANAAVPFAFKVGDTVRKETGDYTFYGTVLTRFRKLNGAPRFVVENPEGILHIFNASQLRKT